MATSTLVSDILTEVTFRLDMPASTSTTFLTSTGALNLAKFSTRRLSSIVRRAFGSDYFTTQSTLTTTPGQNYITLPANFTDLRQIAWLRSTNDSVPLQRAAVDDFLAPNEQAQSWSGSPIYRLQANTVIFFPCPSSAYNLSVYYDTGIFITATSDTVYLQPWWDEWWINDICVKVRQKEELDASDFVRERQIAEENMKLDAAQRDQFRVSQVRQVFDGTDYVDSRSLFVRR